MLYLLSEKKVKRILLKRNLAADGSSTCQKKLEQDNGYYCVETPLLLTACKRLGSDK